MRMEKEKINKIKLCAKWNKQRNETKHRNRSDKREIIENRLEWKKEVALIVVCVLWTKQKENIKRQTPTDILFKKNICELCNRKTKLVNNRCASERSRKPYDKCESACAFKRDQHLTESVTKQSECAYDSSDLYLNIVFKHKKRKKHRRWHNIIRLFNLQSTRTHRIQKKNKRLHGNSVFGM